MYVEPFGTVQMVAIGEVIASIALHGTRGFFLKTLCSVFVEAFWFAFQQIAAPTDALIGCYLKAAGPCRQSTKVSS